MHLTPSSAKRTCTASSTETSGPRSTPETEAKSALTREYAQTHQTTAVLSRTGRTDACSSQIHKPSALYSSAETIAQTPQTPSADLGSPVSLDKLKKPTSVVFLKEIVAAEKSTHLSVHIPTHRKLQGVNPRIHFFLLAIPYQIY